MGVLNLNSGSVGKTLGACGCSGMSLATFFICNYPGERVYSCHLILKGICKQKKFNDYFILANTLPTHLQKCMSLNFCFQMRKYLGGRLKTETVTFLCKQTAFHQTLSWDMHECSCKEQCVPTKVVV